MINKNFWNKKTVLITGHTGFKGSWLSIWLNEMGAKVIGYSLDPHTKYDNFVLSNISNKIIDIRADIRDNNKIESIFKIYKPEIVFHLAAQPIVRLSYKNPKETYETNVMGTLNILECIRQNDYTKVGIFVTTDKCYENKEQIWGYRESDALGGYDPYSSSKACSELIVSSYRSSFMNTDKIEFHQKNISTVRAGNVIGGGDWSDDRLIPDCIKILQAPGSQEKFIKIRNPNAIRPWQHVLEPLSGYILLAEKMYCNGREYSGAWNFGPNMDSILNVWDIAKMVVQKYGSGKLKDVSNINEPHEAKLLCLDISKSRFILGWKPKLSIEQAIDMTVDWYKNYKSQNAYDLCVKQIDVYNSK